VLIKLNQNAVQRMLIEWYTCNVTGNLAVRIEKCRSTVSVHTFVSYVQMFMFKVSISR